MPKTARRGAAPTRHTSASRGRGVMSSSPRFHDAKPTTDWASQAFQYGSSSWQQTFQKHCRHMGFSFNKRQAYSLFYFHVFKATHVYQTRNDTHDLTDDIYSMSTFAVLWRADADSSPSPSLKEFQGLHVLPHLPVRHISQPRHSRGCSPGQP